MENSRWDSPQELTKPRISTLAGTRQGSCMKPQGQRGGPGQEHPERLVSPGRYSGRVAKRNRTPGDQDELQTHKRDMFPHQGPRKTEVRPVRPFWGHSHIEGTQVRRTGVVLRSRRGWQQTQAPSSGPGAGAALSPWGQAFGTSCPWGALTPLFAYLCFYFSTKILLFTLF